MTIKVIKNNSAAAAIVYCPKLLITDTQSALDFAMSVKYETGCERIALNKEALCQDFFVLSTCLAGEILQKFVNYKIKFAVYGDFSGCTSNALKDFIYESNKGTSVFFVPEKEAAAEKLLNC